jgi:hypothetical protein
MSLSCSLCLFIPENFSPQTEQVYFNSLFLLNVELTAFFTQKTCLHFSEQNLPEPYDPAWSQPQFSHFLTMFSVVN